MKVDWKQALMDGIQNKIADVLLVQDCSVNYDESLHKLNVVVTYNQYFTEEMVNGIKEKILGFGSLKYIAPWYGAITDGEGQYVDIQLKFEFIQKAKQKEDGPQ